MKKAPGKREGFFPRIVVSEEIPQWITSSDKAAYHPYSGTIYLRSDRWWKDVCHELWHWFFHKVGLKRGHGWLDKA